MKKSAIKAFIIFFCVMLIIPLMPVIKAEATESDTNIYYCREALKALPNSENLLYAYDNLVAGVEASETEIKVSSGGYSVSPDEFEIVFEAYRRDHTEHFWLGNSYEYYYYGDTIVSIAPEYTMSGATLENAKLEFESAINGILNQITPAMSDYEKEKKVHDILASRVSYVQGANAHNAYGALVDGLAVCEGYAEALQCLLHRVGIQSFLVYGSSENPLSGTSEPHAWNMVRIGGEYYHVDLTWNDQTSNLYYAYFNQTDAVISKDHTTNISKFAIPQCTATEKSYFSMEGYILESYTVSSVAQILSDSDLTARIFLTNGTDDFIGWVQTNIHSVAQELGIYGPYGYSYSSIGNEIILIIDTCQHLNLTFIPTVNATCTQSGTNQHYLCTCGKIFSDHLGKNEIIDTSSLVLVEGHMWTSKIEDSAHLRSTPADCSEYYTYYYGCEKCNAISTDKYYESDKTLPHSLVLVERVEPTCSSFGKEAYYKCECGKCFTDAEATSPISNINAYGRLDRSVHRDINAFGKCSDCNEITELTNTVTASGVTIGVLLIAAPTALVTVKRILRRRK